jgi:hypothetical protein
MSAKILSYGKWREIETPSRQFFQPRKCKKRHSLRVALLQFLHWSLASQKILADGIFRRAYRSCPRPVHPF